MILFVLLLLAVAVTLGLAAFNRRPRGHQPRTAAPESPPRAPEGWQPTPGAKSPFTGQPLG